MPDYGFKITLPFQDDYLSDSDVEPYTCPQFTPKQFEDFLEDVVWWKNIIHGKQDELITQVSECENNYFFPDNTDAHSQVITKELEPSQKITVNIGPGSTTNFKIDHPELIQSVELLINGMVINEFSYSIAPTLRHLYGIGDETVIPFDCCRPGRFLPFTPYSNVQIHFNREPQEEYPLMTLSYTKVFQPGWDPQQMTYSVTQVQSRFEVPNHYHMLQFNHPIYYFIVDTHGHGIEQIDVKLFTDHPLAKFSQLVPWTMYDGKYIVSLTKDLSHTSIEQYGINGTRVDKMYLDVHFQDGNDHPIDVHAVNLNVVRVGDGLLGLFFCN